jgi:hypothetical protein
MILAPKNLKKLKNKRKMLAYFSLKQKMLFVSTLPLLKF